MSTRSKITLKQLEMMISLGTELNFRKAAERVGVSQPSLSAQIQALEEAVGLQLVERARSGTILTPAGREILRRAQTVMGEARGIEDYASDMRLGPAGTIRLGTKTTLGPYILPHLVSRLHRESPDLRLYIRESAPRDLEVELYNGMHDLILVQLPIADTDLAVTRLFREPLYLAVAADHPLASRKVIEPEMLKGLDVLSLNPSFHLHDQVTSLCREFGATLLRDYEGTSLDALRQMVGMGMGTTFLPALYVHSELRSRDDVAVLEIAGKPTYRSIGLAWRKSAGRVSAFRFIANTMRQVVKQDFPQLILE
ncbi:hydrogen peroxide-inducible genes activator [Hwanghaeella sp.]|uniref:hydrogen peroxide-inducible genes activator n=1 Tax=Hwanghaeella sp. TaxID=2605943 RepID=UPI003CCC25AD